MPRLLVPRQNTLVQDRHQCSTPLVGVFILQGVMRVAAHPSEGREPCEGAAWHPLTGTH